MSARTYSQDKKCPHCGSNWLRKYGRSRGRQSYRCGDCYYKFTPGGNRSYYSESVKKQAIQMYTEGSSLSAIGRVLGYSATSVQRWVKKGGSKPLRRLRERRERRMSGRAGQKAAVAVSCDEMWTYVKVRRGSKRNSVWIWTAVVEEEDGSRWCDFEVGGRDERTFLRLYGRMPDAELYRSDAYNVYKWLPANRHKVGKGSEVNRNEGLHSALRGKLNRLVRKTKGCSKSVDMLRGSLALVWLTQEWI